MSQIVVERLKCEKPGRFVNGFMIVKGNKCCIVDCGFGEHFDFIKEKVGSKELKYLFLTHCHLDHCGTAAALKKHFNCKIVLSDYENEMFKKGENSDLKPRTKAFEEFAKNLKKGKVYEEGVGDILIKNDSAFVISKDEDFEIKIIVTPGHTPGSISIISKATKEVFVGDLLYPGDFKGFGQSGFLSSDDDFKKSMKKLQENRNLIEKIHTGHNDTPITFDDFMDYCKEKGY